MGKLDIAIICGPENGSPRVLAETMSKFIEMTDTKVTVYYRAKAIRRLKKARDVAFNPILWYGYKLKYYFGDRKLFRNLKGKDAVIICDWTPNGFYSETYNIEKLKRILNGKPVLYYAVQFLLNSPTIVAKLKNEGHASASRYDWHLAVSAITELRGNPKPPWSQVGMYLKATGLKPTIKDDFLAVVDFLRPGYERHREEQIRVLESLDIRYISLEGQYELHQIREIYMKASLYFIQFPEAFGLPIAECLACGSYVVTADSSWPMSWRLDDEVTVHGQGKLPDCFVVYKDEENLKKQLLSIRADYDVTNTPLNVFNTFFKNYPSFYEGNLEALNEILDRIATNNLKFDSSDVEVW